MNPVEILESKIHASAKFARTVLDAIDKARREGVLGPETLALDAVKHFRTVYLPVRPDT